jgi:hypothetical protein
MDLLVEVVGWLGAAALLLAYGAVSAGRLTPGGGPFQALNLFGAAALAANGAYHGAWPSVGLNTVWVVIGAVALVQVARRVRRRGPAEVSPATGP